jgi:hypothetical protein
MLAIKPGVDVEGIQPEVILGATIFADVMWKHGIPTVITSCRDGKHKDGSLHYEGKAVDIRLASRFNMSPNIDLLMLNEGRAALGEQYDLVLEQDHFHLEFDPKRDTHT